MSEKIHNPTEFTPLPSHEHDRNRQPENNELQEGAPTEQLSPRSLEELQMTAETEAQSATETVFDQTEQAVRPNHYLLQKDLKDAAYNRQLQDIRQQLHPIKRTFSRIFHHATVDTISNVAANTIARPSGLFFAGIFALLGSSLALVLANRYGFSYNANVFVFTFILGYVVGIATETAHRLLIKRKR